MSVPKRLRFEVLRRDNYACRYCGQVAPNVKLTIDHVVPVALGGPDEAGNLVTACEPCNTGKSSIAPDSPLVEDVAAETLRWRQAIREAAKALLEDQFARIKQRNEFVTYWDRWTTTDPWDFLPAPAPLPDGWETSIDNFLAAGLTHGLLAECVYIASRQSKVSSENKFRYMCGIAWKKLAELREIAFSLVAVEDVEEPE